MISVCGVKGSPGASTLALLAAALWPSPAVLVEADPAGGEFALTLAGPQGQALPGKPSIAELALDSVQRVGSPERIWGSALDTAAGVAVVCAIPSAQPMSNLLREYGPQLTAMLDAGERHGLSTGWLVLNLEGWHCRRPMAAAAHLCALCGYGRHGLREIGAKALGRIGNAARGCGGRRRNE